MKKVGIVLLCVLIVFVMSACKKSNTGLESATSSNIYTDKTSVRTQSQANTSSATYTGKTSVGTKSRTNTSSTVIDNTTVSSVKSTTSNGGNSSHTTERSHIEENSNTTENSRVQDSSYEDIVCVKTLGFQKVSFCVQNSNVLIHITIPKEWKLEKNKNGYSIVKQSQTIGSITALGKTSSANESVNLFSGEVTAGDMKITHSIDRIDYDTQPSYTRTLCYSYDDKHGSHKNITLTVDYQEIDSSAVYTMMTEAEKSISSTEKNMGVLQIQDNRNKILILGNSFVNTSNIGSILQDMCGSDVSVEAHSRGYASVATYTENVYMMQNIYEGNYSAVFMCGLYSFNDTLELSNIVDACESSNTQLAIFPAHNENRSLIDDATFMYPNAILIDWKAEIDSLISTGIHSSNFCIDDAHKHSTPLAGYVGAHMIYRAILNKIPQTTSFSQVPKSQIDLLGEYVTSGSIVLFDESSAYAIG